MADNIDKALNGLGLKTDSLPNDWMVTIVNPKSGEPAENMTVAKFSELLAGKMISLLGINELRRGMNFVSFDLAKGESVIVGKIHGLCTVTHAWTAATPCVMMVDSYYGEFSHIAGRQKDNLPLTFEILGEGNIVKDVKITSTYAGNSGKKTKFSLAYQYVY
ncbi:hypothetical protein [Parabacteroides goldsteinii]|uniref:hypothetical protein n=1 Tax=Parabacteroides goldsteinii TaxID=328812 RepID=UPI0032B1D0D0